MRPEKVWTNGELVDADDLNGNFDEIWGKVRFGGDGSDGALAISSGTTTIDCANARVVVLQYTSVSITGTGKLAFSNPHTNGTYIFILSQGDVTLTSSQAPMIDASNMGAAAGNNGTLADFVGHVTNAGGNSPGTGSQSAAGAIGTWTTNGTSLAHFLLHKYHGLSVGAGGGNGSNQGAGSSAGTGGRGGGCLVIECGGAWNFTTASGISVGGTVGGTVAGGQIANRINGAGGGGGGGMFYALYNTLTANSGSVTVAGGAGGTTHVGTGFGGTIWGGGGGGGSKINAGTQDTSGTVSSSYPAGSGGAGYALIAENNSFT